TALFEAAEKLCFSNSLSIGTTLSIEIPIKRGTIAHLFSVCITKSGTAQAALSWPSANSP
ncbi:hypothetical protein, partial [Agathobaculum sp.]|uniref:hypothetical protein n=1 Tax=Agathobaculum sp. TaxID=2048138 RepID=UPI0039A18ECF